MKILKLIIPVLLLLFSTSVKSQVSVNVNIGSPPLWGPVGYSESRYYYLPDVESYYDVQTSMFIYFGGGVWVHRSHLPDHYRNYDLYNGYKVVIMDYHGNAPHTYFKKHKVKYAKGYRGGPQKTIGMKPGKENSHNKNAPKGQPNKKTNKGNNNQGGHHKSNGGSHGGGGKGKNK